MQIVIVVNNPAKWPLDIPGIQVAGARQYLSEPAFARRGLVVFNLCKSYAYQRLGYYVSLLAEARNHRPQPSVGTIEDFRSRAITRLVSEDLSDLIQKSLAPIQSDEFDLSIYFGRPLAKRYVRLAMALFNQFHAPLLRARFSRNGRWQIATVGPIPSDEIPESHQDFVVEAAKEYFADRRFTPRKAKPPSADLAILHDPEESSPPSNPGAIRRFVRAGEQLGMGVELITKEDYGRLAEFDALFIRSTTFVNHYTYRFARRAAAEGLVVVDDPRSIIRCTNKVYTKELLELAKVPIPRTMVVHRDNRHLVSRELGLPCVLKKPDSAFSLGVFKAETEQALHELLDQLFADSELVVAQEFLPTDFDWRVCVFDKKPLYVCRYFMAEKHWQILKHQPGKRTEYGKAETLWVEEAPRKVVATALKAANAVGDGLYGVDLKTSGKSCYVIEVNDNPSIDHGVEDENLQERLYLKIMDVFCDRIEQRRLGNR